MTGKVNTLLDNIFTNQFNPDMVSGNLTVLISDHLASFLIIPNKNVHFLPKKHNITKQVDKRDANYSFNSFYDKIEKVLDKHMPKRKITKNNSNRGTNPGLPLD